MYCRWWPCKFASHTLLGAERRYANWRSMRFNEKSGYYHIIENGMCFNLSGRRRTVRHRMRFEDFPSIMWHYLSWFPRWAKARERESGSEELKCGCMPLFPHRRKYCFLSSDTLKLMRMDVCLIRNTFIKLESHENAGKLRRCYHTFSEAINFNWMCLRGFPCARVRALAKK